MAKAKNKSKMGRPKINIDAGKLDGMLMYGASCLECANELNCSEETIVRFVKRNHGVTFEDYRFKKMGSTRLRLRQKQIATALQGNVTMLIFLGKQLLGQTDVYADVSQKEQIKKLVIDLGNDKQ